MQKIGYLLLYTIFFLFSSCTTLKNSAKHKTENETAESRTISEIETHYLYQPKDSVVFVPLPSYVYKDTTIVKRGQTTTLRLNYNTQGTLAQADCISDEIKEFITTQRQINEQILTQINEKTKDKEIKREPNYWLFISFGILFVFTFLFLLKRL